MASQGGESGRGESSTRDGGERQGVPSIFQKLEAENRRLLDEAARENAEWEEASCEFEFLCQECMAPLVGALDFVGDGGDVEPCCSQALIHLDSAQNLQTTHQPTMKF